MTDLAVIAIHNIKRENGGMTFAALHRANALAGVVPRIKVLTFGFDPDYNRNLAYWKSKLSNSARIEFVNIFAGTESDCLIVETQTQKQLNPLAPGETAFRESNSTPEDIRQRVFNDRGVYVRYESRTKEGLLSFADHFEAPWTRTKKAVYDSQGFLLVEHHMNRSSNKTELSCYFDRSGKPVYTVKLDAKTGKAVDFFSFFSQSQYKALEYVFADWIESHCQNSGEVALFIDKREHVKPFTKCSAQKKFFILHNNHLEAPYNDPTKIGASMQGMIESLDELTKVVVLTSQQQKHLQERFPSHAEKFTLINHPAEPVENQDEISFDPDSKLLVTLARYAPVKNLQHAIRAVAIASKQIPDIQYEIWGYGPAEAELQNLISDLGASSYIKLCGFTNNSGDVYRRGTAMIMSSHFEGQPLVLAEAMSRGVVPIVYDFNYGPREVIRDGIDGFIVKQYDIDALAARIVEFLSSKSLREQMSASAKEVMSRFSRDRAESEWRTLLVD